MINKVIATLVCVSLINTQFAFASGLESEKVQNAQKITDSLFHVQKLKNQLAQDRQELESLSTGSVGSVSKGALITAVLSGSLTLFIAYKFKNVFLKKEGFLKYKFDPNFYSKSGEIGGPLGILFGGMVGIASASITAIAGIYTIPGGVAWVLNYIKEGKLIERIQEAEVVLTEAEAKLKREMSFYVSIDPSIYQKVAAAIESTEGYLPRVQDLAQQLGELKSNLSTENMELGFSGFIAASSVIGLAYSSLGELIISRAMHSSFNWKDRIVPAVLAMLFSAWTVKNINDRQDVIKSIETVEAELDNINEAYKRDFINFLTTSSANLP